MKSEQEIRDYITFCDVQAGFCLERLIRGQYKTEAERVADREYKIMYTERAEALRWVLEGNDAQ